MKNSVLLLPLFGLLFFMLSCGASKKATGQFSQAEIKTSMFCGMCEDNIKEALSYEKGIKSVSLDLGNNLVLVKYDADKTSLKTIKMAISNSGYDADDIKADEVVKSKLPECCRKPGMH